MPGMAGALDGDQISVVIRCASAAGIRRGWLRSASATKSARMGAVPKFRRAPSPRRASSTVLAAAVGQSFSGKIFCPHRSHPDARSDKVATVLSDREHPRVKLRRSHSLCVDCAETDYRRLPREVEPAAAPECPSPPAHLGAYAGDEWWRLAPELFRLGLLTTLDVARSARCGRE
jgi:hypothetical protein